MHTHTHTLKWANARPYMCVAPSPPPNWYTLECILFFGAFREPFFGIFPSYLNLVRSPLRQGCSLFCRSAGAGSATNSGPLFFSFGAIVEWLRTRATPLELACIPAHAYHVACVYVWPQSPQDKGYVHMCRCWRATAAAIAAVVVVDFSQCKT